jgi:hypothetical protein
MTSVACESDETMTVDPSGGMEYLLNGCGTFVARYNH